MRRVEALIQEKRGTEGNGRLGSKEELQHETIPPKSDTEPGIAVSGGKVKDAACGMIIDKAAAISAGHSLTRDGVTYYFCSDRCKKKFSSQPEHYAALNPTGPRS